MKRDYVAPVQKAKISITAAIYSVLRNFYCSSIELQHHIFAFILT